MTPLSAQDFDDDDDLAEDLDDEALADMDLRISSECGRSADGNKLTQSSWARSSIRHSADGAAMRAAPGAVRTTAR